MTLIFLLILMLSAGTAHQPPPFMQTVIPVGQGDSTISLNSNRAAVLRLTGSGQFALASYDSPGGEIITLTAQASGDSLDTVLELLGPDGERIAYNDDWSSGVEITDAPPPFDVLKSTGSALIRVPLAEAGTYTVRVNTFNGEGVGDVMLTLTVEPPLVFESGQSAMLVPLPANAVAEVALTGFEPGAEIVITVRDPRGLLDPTVALVDADGEVIAAMTGGNSAANDDHATPDPSLNRFDARLTATLPTDSAALRITEFLGRSGWLEIQVMSPE